MYLSPSDKWPAHPRPMARAALEEARSAGWWFEPSDGHSFGRLRCAPPSQASGDESCKVPIWSTSGAADGSDTARVIEDALRKCPHEHAPPSATDPEAAARLAAGAQAHAARLIEAAAELLNKQRAIDQAEAILEAAVESDDADETEAIETASDLEHRATLADGRALAAAAQAGAHDPWPPVDGADELLRLADDLLASTAQLVTDAAGSNDAGKLQAEQDRLVEWARTLSSQLRLS